MSEQESNNLSKPCTVPGLEVARHRRAWSIAKLSEACNIPRNSIYRWERGKNEPPASAVRALAGALEVTSDELLGIT